MTRSALARHILWAILTTLALTCAVIFTRMALDWFAPALRACGHLTCDHSITRLF